MTVARSAGRRVSGDGGIVFNAAKPKAGRAPAQVGGLATLVCLACGNFRDGSVTRTYFLCRCWEALATVKTKLYSAMKKRTVSQSARSSTPTTKTAKAWLPLQTPRQRESLHKSLRKTHMLRSVSRVYLRRNVTSLACTKQLAAYVQGLNLCALLSIRGPPLPSRWRVSPSLVSLTALTKTPRLARSRRSMRRR